MRFFFHEWNAERKVNVGFCWLSKDVTIVIIYDACYGFFFTIYIKKIYREAKRLVHDCTSIAKWKYLREIIHCIAFDHIFDRYIHSLLIYNRFIIVRKVLVLQFLISRRIVKFKMSFRSESYFVFKYLAVKVMIYVYNLKFYLYTFALWAAVRGFLIDHCIERICEKKRKVKLWAAIGSWPRPYGFQNHMLSVVFVPWKFFI